MTGISPSNPPQSPVHEAAEAATNMAPVEVDTRPVCLPYPSSYAIAI
jgi:hypothetical protein